MSKFDLENYETVDERIHKFWEMYPDGCIQTDLFSEVRADNRVEWVCKASIKTQRDEGFIVTGWATEYEGANKFAPSNAPELAETSAIGRALANLGLSKVGKRASKEEVASARSKDDAPKRVPEKDPWADGMALLGDALAAKPIDSETAYKCAHGVMVYATGVSKKTNKPWAAYKCPDNIQTCDPKWMKVG